MPRLVPDTPYSLQNVEFQFHLLSDNNSSEIKNDFSFSREDTNDSDFQFTPALSPLQFTLSIVEDCADDSDDVPDPGDDKDVRCSLFLGKHHHVDEDSDAAVRRNVLIPQDLC